MPAFFGVWCAPQNEHVEPRKTIRLSWYYYTVEGDDITLYFDVSWKVAGASWDNAETWRVPFGVNFFDLPPNTWTLGGRYAWRVRAWTQDPTTLAEELSTTFVGNVDADGFTWAVEANGSVNTEKVPIKYTNWGFTPLPLNPGQYEVRVKGRNGLRWSAFSSLATENAYDSRKYQYRSGKWWAIPYKKKTAGTFTVVQP